MRLSKKYSPLQSLTQPLPLPVPDTTSKLTQSPPTAQHLFQSYTQPRPLPAPQDSLHCNHHSTLFPSRFQTRREEGQAGGHHPLQRGAARRLQDVGPHAGPADIGRGQARHQDT